MGIEREDHGGVALLRMAHGKANALDVEFLQDLVDQLDRVEESSAGALVLTGTGTIFSAGVDLFRLAEGGRDYVRTFLPALTAGFHRLFTFPRPVVAAVNGHAIAGGFILMASTDHRLMAAGKGTVGLPELKVGVAFPSLALEIVRLVTPPGVFQELVYLGATYGAEQALERGLVHELVAPDELLDSACQRAERLAAIPRKAFELTKRQVQRPALRRFRELEAEVEGHIAEVWEEPEAADRIRDYLARVVGKRSG